MRTVHAIVSACIACCLLFGCGALGHVGPSEIRKGAVVWRGEWKSAAYPTVYGSLIARLPNHIQMEQTVEIPVAIRFSDTSLYRAGRTYVGLYRGAIISSRAVRGSHAPLEKKSGQKTLARVLGIAHVDETEVPASHFKLYFNSEMDQAEGFWMSSDGQSGTFILKKMGL